MPLCAFGLVYLLFSLRTGGLGVPLSDMFMAVRPSASLPGWLTGANNIGGNLIGRRILGNLLL